jgi:HNH endonuclease
MKEIPLTRGYVAIVDDEDYERVMAIGRWQFKQGVSTIYARHGCSVEGKDFQILLHRFIMDVTDRRVKVDHRDHNGLNNQKSNLRVCTHQQNSMNARKAKTGRGTSRYKGVSGSLNGQALRSGKLNWILAKTST